MAFDPDAYIAQKEAGFDPDAYLAERTTVVTPEGMAEETIQAPASQPSTRDQINRAILATPGGAAVSEFAAAVNRGAINLLDWLGPEQINNALAVIGSEKRIPTVGEQPIVQEATVGEFMDPGLAREAVRTAGEFVAPVGAAGQVVRQAAKVAPGMASTLTQRVAQQAAARPAPEAAGAVLSGAGQEVGAEIGERLGGEEGERIGRMAGGILAPIGGSLSAQTAKTLTTKSAKKLLTESAPTIDGLKQAARSVYNELDNMGVSVRADSFGRLARQLQSLARTNGFNRRIHTKVAAALDEFAQAAATNQPQPLKEVDILRRVTAAAAKSTETDEASLGTLLVNRIDDFLDNAGRTELTKTNKDIGAKYRDARQLWRRARKGELLEDAFTRAQNQATGFENGIRVQFRQILNNKKKRRGFTPEEIKAMETVVRGTTLQNTAKMLGRLGFSEGQASNMLLGGLGVAGGYAVGGGPGAVAVPMIGQVSRKLAQKLTRQGAQGADEIVRAGKEGLDVTKAYMRITKPKQRDAKELAELLLRPDVNLKGLQEFAAKSPAPKRKIIDDAVFLVNAIKAEQEGQ